jgi:uncharacterized protein with HEPN domain
MLDAINEIQQFIAGMDYEAFKSDPKTVKAVQLDLIVIGEAANAVPDAVQSGHPDVPWTLMRAMRNRLVHIYFNVDPTILWQTIREDLPQLVPSLSALAGSFSEEEE